jgi:hypothetical protein
MNKKPPDKYKCIKTRFIKFISKEEYNNKNVFETITDAIVRTNKIVIKSYMLLRLWILKKYENNIELPIITKDTIKMAFKSVVDNTGKQGKRPLGSNSLLLKELKALYTTDINYKLEDGTKLSTILNYYSTTIITSIENNIKNNFINYINRYINAYFIKKYEHEIIDQGTEFKKQLYKDLKVLKKDIIENTTECDDKYKVWLSENRNKIVPVFNKKNPIFKLLYDTPQVFLKYMIHMSKEINKLNKQQFQFFPLQTNNILRHIQIDTGALIELFENKVSDIKKDIEVHKAKIWIGIFKLNQNIKNYVFDYTIITDGFSTTLRFLHKDEVEGEKKKHILKKEGRKKINDKLKGLSKEEKQTEREIIKKEKLNKKVTKNNSKEINNKENPKETKESNDKIPYKYEFPYIDDVNKEVLKGKHIFIDPGKRSLFTMVDNDNKYLKFTNGEYLSGTKRLVYGKRLDNYKTTVGIKKLEQELVNFNSKSCIVEDFIKYIKKKLDVNEQVINKYMDIKFRKYKWYSFINKKRTEDNLLNKIEKHYSKDHIIIIGDWSIGKQMSNFISTPNIALKRKLRERFKVYNIDEFRTSCINYKTEKECDNLWLPGKNKKLYKKHSILTYKMENNRLGCIDRDKNGCQNIKKLYNSYMTSGTIPLVYRRDYKLKSN